MHDGILRLSNDEQHGIVGVGPQWHSDGAFERRPFSHVLFHALRMPSDGGAGTELADLAAAFAALPLRIQADWSRLAIANAYSGAVHPLVSAHPVSGKPSIFAHLGMVGAVIRWPRELPATCRNRQWGPEAMEAMKPSAGPSAHCGHEVLSATETRSLMRSISSLLTRFSTAWRYSARGDGEDAPADVLLVDNLAVAHRAEPAAHAEGGELRILHRTTVAGSHPLDPPAASGLPPFAYVWGDNPIPGSGLWTGSDYYGVGYRWNSSLPMRN